MKHKCFLLAFAILFSSIVNASGQRGAKVNTFAKQPFDSAIENLVEPSVTGYQYVLIKNGKIVTEGAGGKARTGTDGNLDMTSSTPQNIGSLAKFLSGTAMINLFEKPAVKTNPEFEKRGLKGSLDMPVWGELPKVWLNVIPGPFEKGTTQRRITYRKLLQHRSGFDEDWKGEKNLTTLLLQLENQFNPDLFNTRKYSNFNFTLSGYLLPLIEYHNLNHDLDIETNGKTAKEGDEIVRDRLGKRFDALMRERIWNKMSPKFNATCDPKDTVKNTAAYGYPNKSAKGGGFFSSMMEMNGHCAGSGGYFVSARDFANYVAHFSQSDLIVTKSGRDEMYNDAMPSNDRLVWTDASTDTWISQNFGMPRVAWSNGITGGLRTVLLRLPENYYLVLFTTSAELSVSDLFKVGTLAFREGMKHNF